MGTGRVHAKIALVTGGGSGIGRATAILLAKEGTTVIVSDIDAHAAEQVANEIREEGGKAEAVKLDVAEESAWISVIDATKGASQVSRVPESGWPLPLCYGSSGKIVDSCDSDTGLHHGELGLPEPVREAA